MRVSYSPLGCSVSNSVLKAFQSVTAFAAIAWDTAPPISIAVTQIGTHHVFPTELNLCCFMCNSLRVRQRTQRRFRYPLTGRAHLELGANEWLLEKTSTPVVGQIPLGEDVANVVGDS